MKAVLVALFLGLMVGCSSLTGAGHASYSVEPILVEGKEPICCKVSIANGKEYTALKAHIEKKADGGYVIDLEEKNVKAFEGQTKAGDVVKAGVEAAAGVAAGAIIP